MTQELEGTRTLSGQHLGVSGGISVGEWAGAVKEPGLCSLAK